MLRGTAGLSWQVRVVLAVAIGAAIAVIWVSNMWLTQRFTEDNRNEAALDLALYSGAIDSELRRAEVVPLLLSRDPLLQSALSSGEFTQTSQRLISYRDEIGAAALTLLERDGRVVAATERTRLGERLRQSPFFVAALRSTDTVFNTSEADSGRFDFTFARRVDIDGQLAGVVLVEVNLARLMERWRSLDRAIFVTDSAGRILLSTEPRWRGGTEAEGLARQSPPSAIQRAIDATDHFGTGASPAYLRGQPMMRLERQIPFRGWRVISYTTLASVRERVNGFLALEIMAFALLLAGTFYLLSRRARLQSAAFQQESAELRRLNRRLQREIAERQKVQRNLAEAEQSLAQSSKLAALGEMSAAVSHELNQPLAAMKTYLAGARLLLQRKRPEEALSSFQRIDDLLERMGAITRQLKSYARKGDEAFAPVDMREALSSALSMMEPQMKSRVVHLTQTVPPAPVVVMADRLRLEQVVINLLRNAMDAVDGQAKQCLDLILAAGDEAVLTVRDNGHGISNLENLFEPFYTTKGPGDGVGLGLAISSGIVGDLGGRLTARNAADGGAVFEVRLPIIGADRTAAE